MWPWTGKVKVRVTQKGCSQGDLIKVYSHARHCVCSHKHEREQTSTQRLTKMWTDERTDRRILSINKPELLCDPAKNVIIFGTPLFEPFRYYMCLSIFKFVSFLCRLRSIAAHRDHFVRRLSVCPSFCLSVRLSGSHTFLVVTHSYVSQATHAFLGMLTLCWLHSFCS